MNLNDIPTIKYYVVIFKMYILMSTDAELLSKSENDYNMSSCGSVVFNKRPQTHTFVLDTLQNNWSLNNCLNSLMDDGSKIIFTSDNILDPATKTKLKHFIYNKPNIVIFTWNLSDTLFVNPVAEVLLQSHWSLINIKVVDNYTFSCENGYFGREVNETINKFLNKMWEKYQIVYVVVEYPNVCPNKYSTYSGDKKPSRESGKLYGRTVTTVDASDLHKTLNESHKNLTFGYPLSANIFYRFPTSITECKKMKSFMVYNSNLTNGYCGVDALVMHDVMQAYKFNTSKLLTYPNNYGYVQAGHATGTLGLVVRGEIDISFNSRFMVLYSYPENSFEFLNYIWSDSLCAFMKEPSQIPLWQYPVNFVNPVMWIFILSCLAFVGLLMYVRSKITIKFGGHSFKPYVYVVNAIWSGLLGFFFNKRIKRSLLAATCLLSSVIVTARYQGHVNYMFATLLRYNRYSTLEEMCNNNVQVYTAPSIVVLLNSDYSDGLGNNAKTELIKHLKYYPANASTIDYALSYPNIATVERADTLLQSLVKYRDKDGRSLLYTVDECFQTYYLSYIVRSGFLFTHDLKILLMKIVEAGLPTVYYKWTQYTFAVMDRDKKPISEPRPTIKIGIHEQRIPFILLLLGYAVSIAAFGVELWCGARRRRARNVVVRKYLN